jgi:hypothetical protein
MKNCEEYVCEISFCFLFVTFVGIGKFCVTLVTVDWFLGHFSLLTVRLELVGATALPPLEMSRLSLGALSGLNSWTSIIRGKDPFLREVYRALQTEERYIWFRAIFWPFCVLVYVGPLLVKLAECVQFSLFVTEGLCLQFLLKVWKQKF